MPELLLELFSEEIPARMQAKAADDLRRMVTDRLVAEGLVYEGAKAFATPRRLALTVHGIPARQPDLKDERRGPKVGAPAAAVQGFLKSTGLVQPCLASTLLRFAQSVKAKPSSLAELFDALLETSSSINVLRQQFKMAFNQLGRRVG